MAYLRDIASLLPVLLALTACAAPPYTASDTHYYERVFAQRAYNDYSARAVREGNLNLDLQTARELFESNLKGHSLSVISRSADNTVIVGRGRDFHRNRRLGRPKQEFLFQFALELRAIDEGNTAYTLVVDDVSNPVSAFNADWKIDRVIGGLEGTRQRFFSR